VQVIENNYTFNAENVRVCKILGSQVQSSSVMGGMVLKREIEGAITKAKNCKIALYSCPIDLIPPKNKDSYLDTLTSEKQLYTQIRSLHYCKVNVVICGDIIGDKALQYLNQFNIMAIRVLSNFELRRVAKTLGCTILDKIQPPTDEETGSCQTVEIVDFESVPVIAFDKEKSSISTIIVRGSNLHIMDDIERTIEEGIKALIPLMKIVKVQPRVTRVDHNNRERCKSSDDKARHLVVVGFNIYIIIIHAILYNVFLLSVIFLNNS
jgi:T-complex protein 1 subunit theta